MSLRSVAIVSLLLALGAIFMGQLGLTTAGLLSPGAPDYAGITVQQVNREAHPSQLAQRPGAPGSVPMALRRATSETCDGYNVELVEAAAIETRRNRHDNAARLLGMRQDCTAATPEYFRSSVR